MNFRKALFLASLFLVPSIAFAQTSLDLMDVDILFVGAHPDDDTGILGTFARYLLDEGFRGSVITATGGEGGGNAIGPEAGKALGLIRKEEERRALALVGVDSPSFLGLTDFYFTLSAEEASRKWGKDFVCDVVRLVRLERPEVIVTMWPGPGTHGQHQMAGRAATIAFEKASDPSFCPEQVTTEFLRPFEPLKLYYYDRESPTSVAVPTKDYSKARYMPYAELKALGRAMYRSQGFDRFATIPVEDPSPERFMLVRSRVPVASPETHLLGGALVPAGGSPPGMKLEAEPERFTTGLGVPLTVNVTFENDSDETLEELDVSLEAPGGFRVEPEGTTPAKRLGPGERVTTAFRLVASTTPGEIEVDRNQRITARYRARRGTDTVSGSNFNWIQTVAPVRVRFVPTFDVADYRKFARDTKTEWVIETLPTRVPLLIGRESSFRVAVDNASDRPARGRLSFDLPTGARVVGTTDFEVAAGASVEVPVRVALDDQVLPEGRHSAKIPIGVRTVLEGGAGPASEDRADLYALPTLAIPFVAPPPRIDGDLSDMESYARGEIGPEDLWWRRKPDGPLDSSAVFYLGYDRDYLYASVRVRDETVVCNIAPDDIRAQLRSDAVGITVDPSGASQDTSTVLQAAAFPCTTEGFRARGFRDADANQGLMEETAPGMEVASRRTDDGYTLEMRIPWSAMPSRPQPGDEIAVNVIIYDGDDANARVGANISQSGIGWAAFSWGGKQALPYLWPRVTLEPSPSGHAVN